MRESDDRTSEFVAGSGDPRLVTIQRCIYAWQAEAIRIRLAEAGIPAFVTEAETSTMLSYVGTAIGGVRVRVPIVDRQRALQILADDALRLESAGPWRCGRCGEDNEPAFELCWSCNMPRSDDDLPAAAPNDVAEPAADAPPPPPVAERSGRLPPEDLAPYRPAASTGWQQPTDAAIAEDAARRARYAFRAAVLGFFLLPPLLHLYSFVLLLRLVAHAGGVPAAIRGRYWLTWLLNMLGLVWGGAAITYWAMQP